MNQPNAPAARKPISPAKSALRLAAIDVGSNSVHMIIAQIDEDGSVTTLWRMKEMVGLGRMSFPSRRLSRESMENAFQALARFQQAAQSRQVEKIVAVATSAVREAENGGDFILRVKRELGLHIRVISAREEARLIYIAVRHSQDLGSRQHLIIDIGGGSVEFIIGDGSSHSLLESRKLGASRMTAQYVHSDPISKEDRARLSTHYNDILTPLCEQIAQRHPVAAIGTSGTLECLATISGGESTDGVEKPRVIEREAFAEALKKLIKSDSKERSHMRGVVDQRRDQIVAGAMLVGELFERLNLKSIQMANAALREGILLDYLHRHSPEMTIRREVPDPRRRSVLDLARRCAWHKTHSEHVASLCMSLFDQLRPLHHLGPVERELIESAALLHDIGWHIGHRAHHKHSAYLIRHGELKGFSKEEIEIVANIARHHRKSPPKRSHDTYMMLSSWGRRVVDCGVALLRVADGLDRSHVGVITKVSCKIGEHRVKTLLTARADAELELWGARRKMKYFDKVFGYKISFELDKR